jgi:hypothetical protein
LGSNSARGDLAFWRQKPVSTGHGRWTEAAAAAEFNCGASKTERAFGSCLLNRPESLAAIDGLQGLKYVKGKDKILLVRPSTGIVVDEVAM